VSVALCVAVYVDSFEMSPWLHVCCSVLQCAAVCCSVLQCVLQCVESCETSPWYHVTAAYV